ncbi:MAG: Do family serine endopeptidase [Candidatus Cyclobacteriaceae bacterium M2_1C_046]
MKKFSTLILAAILGSGITIGVNELVRDEPAFFTGDERNIPVSHVNYVDAPAEQIFDFTEASKKAMPAVVHIRSTQTARRDARAQQQIPEEFRDFFGPFLRERQDIQPRPRSGSGSGVIINSDGFIVTNNHVIDNADVIEVTLNDNRSYTAKVIGADPTTDIAVIKIEESGLPHLSMVDSDQVQVGEWVLAVGNPFSLTSTATAGIVSAKGRSINILTDTMAIESFIQTDAAVNPGNSGGALVNITGGLIGINTAIASPTGAFSGYAFAVPSNIVNRVVQDLITYGEVQRGLIGVEIRNVTSELVEELDLQVNRGAYVAVLAPQGAAREAGIKEGDVITEIDGKIVRTPADLIGLVATKRPGDVVNVKVSRDGRERTFNVTLKNFEGGTEPVKREKAEILTALGAELEDVDRETLKRLNISSGVKVTGLMAGKIRQNTDMREGFIITKIDNQPVRSKEQVVDILKNKKGGILMEGVYEDRRGTYYYGLGL